MSDEVSINDLPEAPNDGGTYLVSGKHLRVIRGLFQKLFRGDNVSVCGGLEISKADGMGYSITGRPGGGGAGTPCWLAGVQYWTSADDLEKLKASLATDDDPDPDIRKVQPVFAQTNMNLSQDF
ncbi:hypothetical protein SAMN05444156_3219 [Verrucomicrobium sp. GAS474]|uniref:hypothetical protein n=1 Tax=Verrucomicrobium sp. GAS474 TaxID=1882831 RepID=UPI00087BCA2E|nr:hypothetical protein [Verrucomicrobium sp. GAS474]SDU31074.1 hypothetical protein SAMN05444156_3219 [Verrucomicrobium sp. GAS474]